MPGSRVSRPWRLLGDVGCNSKAQPFADTALIRQRPRSSTRIRSSSGMPGPSSQTWCQFRFGAPRRNPDGLLGITRRIFRQCADSFRKIRWIDHRDKIVLTASTVHSSRAPSGVRFTTATTRPATSARFARACVRSGAPPSAFVRSSRLTCASILSATLSMAEAAASIAFFTPDDLPRPGGLAECFQAMRQIACAKSRALYIGGALFDQRIDFVRQRAHLVRQSAPMRLARPVRRSLTRRPICLSGRSQPDLLRKLSANQESRQQRKRGHEIQRKRPFSPRSVPARPSPPSVLPRRPAVSRAI